MKKLLFLVTFLSIALGYGQISITGTGAANTYSQDFDTLAITGTTNTTVPTGWAFSETGTGANANYSAGTGSGTSGDTYSFGTAASTERAFGGLQSGSVAPTIGASFTNNTGATITELVITYKGETWRIGATNRSDRLDFQYSVNATSLATGTWTDDNTLDYANPGQSPTASGSQLHTANLSSTITGLGIANGATFWIRWTDFNPSGSDDGMAVDDFSLYANGGGATLPEINIKGNNVSIVDGATPAILANHTLFGTVATNTPVVRTFTIENTGSADLVLTSPYVQLTLGSSQYTITQPALTTIPVGGSTTFSVTFNSATAGVFDDGIEVLSDDADEANYSFDISATSQAPTPEINIRGNSTNIVDGATTPLLTDHTSFGTLATGNTLTRTYTIQNLGTGDLTLTAPYVQLATASTQYTITQPALTTIPVGGSTTFSVAFSSATAGTFNNTIEVLSDDADEATYSFAITADAVVLNFQPGDISFIGVTTDSDVFSFVNWIEIPVNAQLSFTDNAYEAGALKTNENTLVWRNNTGSSIQPGTVITVTCPGAGAATTDLGIVVSGSLNGLSAANENLFIYEGLSSTPNFIYGFSNIAWLVTGTVSTNNSYLPAALNVTNGNIVVGTLDNYEYSGLRSGQIAIVLYKDLVNTPANWTGNDTIFALSSTDFTYTSVITQLNPTLCGVTLSDIYSGVQSVIVNGATGYRYEVTNVTNPAEPVQVISKNVHWFRLTELPKYDYQTTYSVKVMMQIGGVWLGYYGSACLVTTPNVPSVVTPFCGSTLPKIYSTIYTKPASGVTGYRYRVTNGAEIQILDRTQHFFNLTQLPSYVYGVTYTVEISVKTTGDYSPYGNACTLSSPNVPSIAECGQTLGAGATISVPSLSNVTNYAFEVTNLTTMTPPVVINRSAQWMPLSLIPGYSSSNEYSIRVALTSSGVQSDYGLDCSINASAPKFANTSAESQFKVVGFPNPFTNSFALDITKANDENVSVKVYDMIGKLIDNVTVNATDNSLELGANYPTGVYNVIVSQGGSVNSVRMIKR